jgi:hypothetical protein
MLTLRCKKTTACDSVETIMQQNLAPMSLSSHGHTSSILVCPYVHTYSYNAELMMKTAHLLPSLNFVNAYQGSRVSC